MAICPKCSVNERLPSKAYCRDCLNTYKRNYFNGYYKKNEKSLRQAQAERYTNDEEYRQKKLARSSASYHHLVKQPCSRCGSTKNVERHHPNYSKPNEIMWLCKDHHLEEH